MRRTIFPAVLFLSSGVLHFVRPNVFASIVPPALGHAPELVAVSGAAEIAGAVGLLIPRTRRAAAWGLGLLLVAVWPANWYMALDARRFAAIAPAWVWWARVPLQVLLLWWVAWSVRPEER